MLTQNSQPPPFCSGDSWFKQYLPYYKRNLKVAIPLILSYLGGAAVQFVDTWMVGNLGTEPLAAVSFASSVFLVGYIFALGILIGLTPLVGVAFVRQENRRVADLFGNSLTLTVLTIVIICVALLLIRLCMPFMGQNEAVVQQCLPYYDTLILSLIPFLFFQAGKQFLEGLGNTSAAMIVTIIANLANVLLDYALIYGKLGFPQMGVLGAGIATLIARALMPLLLLLALRLRAEWWYYVRLFTRKMFSWRYLRELIVMGFPIAVHMTLEMSAFSFCSVMVGWIGAAALAANQIAMTMANTLFMVILGIGAAATIRVSHQIGARNLPAARMAAHASFHLAIFYNIVVATLIFLFRAEIVTQFSHDPAVIAIGSTLMIMVAMFQIFDGLQCVGAGILRGLADVKIIILYAAISYIGINVPVAYLLGFVVGWAAPGIWIGFSFGLCCMAMMFQFRYKKTFRKLAER